MPCSAVTRDPLGKRAAEIFAGQLAADRVPSVRAIRAQLALDRRATGDRDAAQELEAHTLAAYDQQLTPEHPQTRRAHQHGRISVEIIPATN
jgi:hypothetical protein